MNRFSKLGLAAAASLFVFTAPAFADGDAAKGERVFKKCISCHSLEEGTNKIGPSLYNVIGRHAGVVEGFRYSKLNHSASEADLIWDENNLVEYLADPQAFLSDFLVSKDMKPRGRTKMTFKLKKEQERADVVAYLKSLSQ